MIEAPFNFHPAQIFVGEVQRGVPVLGWESVPVRLEVHPHTVCVGSEEFIHRSRGENRLPDRIGHADFIT